MAFGETVPADEEEFLKRLGDVIAEIQRSRVERGGEPARVTHGKQHLGAVGELVVTAEASARQGVFGESGRRWPVYVRFSNGSGRHQADGAPDARGFAVKLVGVPGKKLIEGLEQEITQDFLFIDAPAIPFHGPEEFLSFVLAAKDGPAKLLPRLISSFGFGRALGILWKAVRAEKVKSFATHAFHTAAPIAFGASAAKLALFPKGNAEEGPSVGGANYLRDDAVARIGQGPLSWSLRAQRFVDEATTPIEDAAVEWTGPWVELGTLTLPRQDTTSPRGREISELVSRLSFDPWHATEDHRPLGGIMRARRIAYAPSVIGRKAASEPKNVLEASG